MDNKKPKSIGTLIIGSAIIWGAVMIGCSIALRETECYQKIQFILFGGTAAHLILIWGPMAAMVAKMKKENKEKQVD
jgi:hypothetical protein